MLITNPRSRPATPVRFRSPHSMTITASPGSATSAVTSMSATPGKTSSGGGGGSLLTTRASLPRPRSANAIASDDPMASPSGRACETITKRCRVRIAAATCALPASVAVVVIAVVVAEVRVVRALRLFRMEVAQDLFDAVLMSDRLVEPELQLRHAPQIEPAAHLAAEERRRALE